METESPQNFENAIFNSKNINLSSFSTLSVIGKGSYAKVILVKKIDNGKLYALKILKKKYLKKKKQINHTKIERNILSEVSHPFIVKMDFAFQNETKLFFGLEYCPGGELFNLLQKFKKFNENHLKPENILICENGYIKLTDFGLSKDNFSEKNLAYSMCGTPEYLAPEILLGKGHGKEVDWWTLGSLIYEMYTGLPPFYSENRNELFEKIKYSSIRFSKKMSPAFIDFLIQLTRKNPKERLGSINGSSDIKNHEWFKNFDWDKINKKEITPPYYPSINNENDVSNFDCEFTECPIYSPENSSINSNPNFENFSYYKSSMSNPKLLFPPNEYDEFEENDIVNFENKDFTLNSYSIANIIEKKNVLIDA